MTLCCFLLHLIIGKEGTVGSLQGGVVGSPRPLDAIGGREAPTTVGSPYYLHIKYIRK